MKIVSVGGSLVGRPGAVIKQLTCFLDYRHFIVIIFRKNEIAHFIGMQL